MKKMLSLILALVLIATCLSGVVFADDPIAEVTVNGVTTKVNTVDEMRNAVKNPEGTSKIKLLKDVTHSTTIEFYQACYLDLNGFTIKSAKGNCIRVYAPGTVNTHFTIENGTVIGTIMGLRIDKGGLIAKNCTIVAPSSVAVGIYEADTAYNEGNLIENCTLIAGGNGCFSWHADASAAGTAPQYGMDIKIQNTTMVQFSEGMPVLNTRTPDSGNMVTLGENITILANQYSEKLYADGMKIKGTECAKGEEGLKYTFGETTYPNLAKYTNVVAQPETPATPAVPETPAQPATPAAPATPATPSVPTTNVPDVNVPKTGASVIALGVMAMVSLAGAALVKKH